ncbi:hypothetical protein B1B_12377, partial [mine drainage metagenome]
LVAPWSVNLGGVVETGAGQDLTFNVSNGHYNFSVIAPPGSVASPASGVISLDWEDEQINITLTQVTYTVTFAESGLPSGTTWSVTLNGVARSSATAA